jgi:hypothetical protein
MSLAQAIDEADSRWQHGIGDSGANWEDYIAAAVIEWFKSQEEAPTDIVSDYVTGHTYDRT